MRAKVYLTILTSLLLAMAVNAAGGIAGKHLQQHSTQVAIELALGSRSIADLSREEASQLMRSPDFFERLLAAEREVSGEYWWYVVANFAIQFLLILVIGLACGKFVIGTVVRHAKP